MLESNPEIMSAIVFKVTQILTSKLVLRNFYILNFMGSVASIYDILIAKVPCLSWVQMCLHVIQPIGRFRPKCSTSKEV